MNLTDRAFDASVTLDTKLKRFQKGSILVVISLVLGGIAWLDRVTNELPVHHLYYLPIILAVVRFGWRGGWLTQPDLPAATQAFTFNRHAYWAKGLYHQLEWAADVLNAGFYAPTTRNYWRVQFLNGAIASGLLATRR